MKETEFRKTYRTSCEYYCDSQDSHRRPCNRFFCLNYNCHCTDRVRCPRMRWYDFDVLGITEGLRCRHCSHATQSSNGYILFSHSCTLHHEYRGWNDEICSDFDYDVATDQTLDKEYREYLKRYKHNRPFEEENLKRRKR